MDSKYEHRDYYAKGRKYEPKDIIAMLGLNFNLGNTVKYISRAGRKPGISTYDDISKAKTYIEFERISINKGLYSKWYGGGNNNISNSQERDILLHTILDDWGITDNYLVSAFDDIFTAATKTCVETNVAYQYLTDARFMLNSYLEKFNTEPKEDVKPESAYHVDYISGWNDAMNDVIEYVDDLEYYPPTDLIGHCKASKK